MAALAAGAVMAALVFAGCGSDSSGGTTSKTAAAASTPKAPASTVSGRPIVVGSICSCSGLLASSNGRGTDVIQAWAKWTNAHGGLNGHPVKVISADDGQNPAKGLAAAKSLVEQHKVMAIVGQMSLTTEAWQKYVSSKGIPVVGGETVDTAFLTNPDFFISGSNLMMNLYGVVALAKEAGKKHVGVLYCAESPVCAQVPKLVTAFAKPMGLGTSFARVSSSAPNYTAPCLSFKQKGVDAMNVAVNSSDVPRIVGACAQQGFQPVNLASGATTERSWTKDSSLDGSLVAGANAVYTDMSVPGVKAFTDAMNQYVPGLTDSSHYSWTLVSAWAGGQLFSAAAKAAKLTPSSTPASVKKGLYALKDETLDGLAPPLNFVRGKPGFPSCYFQAKIGDGGFQSLNGGKSVCVPAAVTQQLAAALGG
jgi:branched-chain amino acid transport system substrate-binding protein